MMTLTDFIALPTLEKVATVKADMDPHEAVHDAHGGDERPDLDDCMLCIASFDFYLRYGEGPMFYAIPPMPTRRAAI